MQIVLARLDDGRTLVKAGRTDLGESNEFQTTKVPVAAMWLNDGTESDRARAELFAGTEGYSVFCYDGEHDPLARARQEISNHVT